MSEILTKDMEAVQGVNAGILRALAFAVDRHRASLMPVKAITTRGEKNGKPAMVQLEVPPPLVDLLRMPDVKLEMFLAVVVVSMGGDAPPKGEPS